MKDPGDIGFKTAVQLNHGEAAEGEDLISGLARVVLQRLEAIEKESGLYRMRELPESQVEDDTLQLLHGLDGLKSRLRWIAAGM